MVDIQESRLDAVFRALSDPTRRLMLRRLAQGHQTVGQLAEPFSMSLAAASKHIKSLEGSGLITREVQGRTHVCHLNAGPLSAANAWLSHYERFWTARLDRLEELLQGDSQDTPARAGTRRARSGARRTVAKSTNLRKRSTR